jgi:MFS family permease
VRRAVRIDIGAAVLVALFTGVTGPFTGLLLRRDLGATPLQLSLMASAGAACLLTSVAWVRVIDGRAPLPWVVWPTFVARALYLLVPVVGSAWSLVGIVVSGSLLNTLVAPAHAAVIQRVYPRAQRGRALGFVRTIGAVAAVLLAPALGGLIGAAGYRWVLAAAAVAGMGASLCLSRLPVGPADGEVPARPGLREAWAAVRRDAAFRRLLAAMFVFGSGVWLQMPANTLMIADVLAATPGQVGLFAAVGALAALAGNAVWGRLADRWSSRHALRWVYAVGALSPLLYALAGSPWMLAATAVTDALMHTGLDLVWTLAVIDVAGPRRVTQYMAIAGTLAGVRGVLAPLVAGALITAFGVHAVYVVAAVAMAIAAGWLARPTPAAGREVAATRPA